MNRSHFYRLVRSNFEKIVPDSIVLSCIGFLVADGLRTNGNFLKSAEDIAPLFFSFSLIPLQQRLLHLYITGDKCINVSPPSLDEKSFVILKTMPKLVLLKST